MRGKELLFVCAIIAETTLTSGCRGVNAAASSGSSSMPKSTPTAIPDPEVSFPVIMVPGSGRADYSTGSMPFSSSNQVIVTLTPATTP